MQADVLMRGVELTLVGMGSVLVFLSALIGATTLMSRLVVRPEPEPAASRRQVGPDEVAAITAAIVQYRRDHP
jgi:oxaloacetate decarboxylase gamma subunit